MIITNGTLSVKFNDMYVPYFTTGKGVRQGMITLAQHNNLIKGLVPEYIENGVVIL